MYSGEWRSLASFMFAHVAIPPPWPCKQGSSRYATPKTPLECIMKPHNRPSCAALLSGCDSVAMASKKKAEADGRPSAGHMQPPSVLLCELGLEPFAQFLFPFSHALLPL